MVQFKKKKMRIKSLVSRRHFKQTIINNFIVVVFFVFAILCKNGLIYQKKGENKIDNKQTTL